MSIDPSTWPRGKHICTRDVSIKGVCIFCLTAAVREWRDALDAANYLDLSMTPTNEQLQRANTAALQLLSLARTIT